MNKIEQQKIARDIVEYFNPDMGKKWDTKMYTQKAKVLDIIKNNSHA